MTKIIILIVLICMCNASFQDFGGNKQPDHFRRPDGGTQWLSKLCENGTLARSILTKVREVITTLERNNSYTKILEKHAHVIAYIKSDANANVLSSNCPEYFNGLNNARQLDRTTGELQEYYEQNASKLFRQMLQSIITTRNFDFF